MEITIQQLESLLNQQRTLCKIQLDEVWGDSDFLETLTKMDNKNLLTNRFHEVRDKITAAGYPPDFECLKRYIKH